MKKLIFTLLILLIFSININSIEKKLTKRHYFDLCFTTGFSYRFTEYIDTRHVPTQRRIITGLGAVFGGALGYQYAFNDYFAFGPGVYIFGGVMDEIEKSYDNENNNLGYKHRDISPINGGSGLALLFMFGSLDKHRIAFLLDIGGGQLFIIKFGIYAKGFIFKIGYHVPWILYEDQAWTDGIFYAYNITFDFGYKFNWGKRKKIR